MARTDPPAPAPTEEDDDLVASYDYPLDPDRIAAAPAPERDASRLLVYDRTAGSIHHSRFREIGSFLTPGDLLVLNDTRVLHARLEARRASGGRVEILLQPSGTPARGSSPAAGNGLALLKPSAKVRQGEVLELPGGHRLRVDDPPGPELRRVSFDVPLEVLLEHGRIPLPPYLPREGSEDEGLDRERYQTVLAARPGAVAAPTAGLHFTRPLLVALAEHGIDVACLTLHVGPGTFLPVRSARLSQHHMHEEVYEIPPATAAALERARRRGGRIVAVGTTTTRALEAAATDREPQAGRHRTELLIRPPFRFRGIDALVTNFHLPRSTLLALVGAFVGRRRLLELYRIAIDEGYRFYSYGDAMLLL